MTPTKFQHAGLDWIPHVPGDPMPCPGDTMVRVLYRDKIVEEHFAHMVDWCELAGSINAEVIGWTISKTNTL